MQIRELRRFMSEEGVQRNEHARDANMTGGACT